MRIWAGVPAIVLLAANVHHGAAQQKPEFEVASVRQNKSQDKPQSNFSLDNGNLFTSINEKDVLVPTGGLFSAANYSLLTYITFAYKLTGTQFLSLRFKEYIGQSSNLPRWANEERFDIQARAPENTTEDQMRQMLQTLLEDRFKLKVHRETRQVQVLALVPVQPGKLGSQIGPHPANDPCTGESAAGFPRVCGVIAHLMPTAPGRSRFGGRDVPLDLLAGSLPTQTGLATLRQPVIDRTGLAGGYDFTFEWLPDAPGGAAPASDISGPTFAAALKDQLGLKLVPERGPVEVLVIDSVEEPTAN